MKYQDTAPITKWLYFNIHDLVRMRVEAGHEAEGKGVVSGAMAKGKTGPERDVAWQQLVEALMDQLLIATVGKGAENHPVDLGQLAA